MVTILSNAVWAQYRLKMFYSLELLQDKNDVVFSIHLLHCCNLIHNEGPTNDGC